MGYTQNCEIWHGAYQLVESYLSDRHHYVEVQGYHSSLRECRRYSVIQGGKLSGQFFGVYTLEMSQIEETMNNDENYKYITGEDLTHNKTSTIKSSGYVDDINHIASNNSKEQLQEVTQYIYKLVRTMYSENRLKVNDSKNQLLQIESNTTDGSNPNRSLIKVYDKDDKLIKAQNTMKSLGFILNSRGTLDSHLSKMKARIGLEYSKLKPYLNLMSQSDRKLIVNSKLRSH